MKFSVENLAFMKSDFSEVYDSVFYGMEENLDRTLELQRLAGQLVHENEDNDGVKKESMQIL
jgi:hypothetical protein